MNPCCALLPASQDELVRSVRSGVLLDIAALPTLSLVDRHGQASVLGMWLAGWLLCMGRCAETALWPRMGLCFRHRSVLHSMARSAWG